MIIKAKKNTNGKWIMVDSNGNYPQEGLEHKSRRSVYKDASAMYSKNSVWQGVKVHTGYKINTN